MGEVAGELAIEIKIHLILENYCMHKKYDEWLAKYPNFAFYFNPS
jgi:hypothetical protein